MPRKENSKETKNLINNNLIINNLTFALDNIEIERNDEKRYSKFTYPLTENREINFIVYSGIKSNTYEMYVIEALGIRINVKLMKCKDGKIHCILPCAKDIKGNYHNNVSIKKEITELICEIYEHEFYEE